MADKNKFEEMLERLINEDKQGAEDLFHEIVVEKSREIYENLLESDYEDEEDDDVEEGSYKKKKKDDDEEMSEDFDLDEFEVAEEEPEEDPMAMGGDETDDLEMDVSMDGEEAGEMDMDGEEDGEVEDRVEDLEDALDELKAEFEKMMADENGEEGDDEESDMDDMEEPEDDDEEGDMDDIDDAGEEEKEAFDPTDQVATMREYVEKVTAKMGDDGANKQSTVAGANDMGGTAENIARGDTENGVEANKGNLKGSALSDQTPKDMSTGNVNVPGGKASKSMKNQPKGHGAEKKGSGESGTDAHSTIGSK